MLYRSRVRGSWKSGAIGVLVFGVGEESLEYPGAPYFQACVPPVEAERFVPVIGVRAFDSPATWRAVRTFMLGSTAIIRKTMLVQFAEAATGRARSNDVLRRALAERTLRRARGKEHPAVTIKCRAAQ